MKREKLINAQQKEKLLRVFEYLKKELKTGTSRETKGSKDFTSEKFCMSAEGTFGGEQTTDVSLRRKMKQPDVL